MTFNGVMKLSSVVEVGQLAQKLKTEHTQIHHGVYEGCPESMQPF
jgi:hypothetical protein